MFTGENTYLLRQERRRWLDEFEKKHGSENIQRIDGPKITIRALLDEVSIAPFIAAKRLVVIDGVPKFSKEDVQLLAQAIHPDSILLIVDPKPDKRLGGTKELIATATTKEFAPLQGPPLRAWIAAHVAQHGSKITTDAMETLIEMIGEDQDLLAEELKKLALFAGACGITRHDAEEMTTPTAEGIIWRLSDLLAAGKKEQAAAYAKRMLDRGSDAYGMWAILLNLLKNVCAVHAAVAEGGKDNKAIAEETGIHPFAIRSIVPHASSVNRAKLQAFLEWACAADVELKTGGYRATDEFPQEIMALVDRFLLAYPAR